MEISEMKINKARRERAVVVMVYPDRKFGYMRSSKFTLTSEDPEFLESQGDFKSYVEESKERMGEEYGGFCMDREDYETLLPFDMVPTLGTRRDEYQGSMWELDIEELHKRNMGPKWLLDFKKKHERRRFGKKWTGEKWD